MIWGKGSSPHNNGPNLRLTTPALRYETRDLIHGCTGARNQRTKEYQNLQPPAAAITVPEPRQPEHRTRTKAGAKRKTGTAQRRCRYWKDRRILFIDRSRRMTLREIPRSKGPFGIVVGSYGVKCSVGPRGHHANNVGQFNGPIPVSFEDSNFCKNDTQGDKMMDRKDDVPNKNKHNLNQSNHKAAKEQTKTKPTATIEDKQQGQQQKQQNKKDSNANGNTNANVFAAVSTAPFEQHSWMLKELAYNYL